MKRRVAIVTGGSRGIGAAITRRLAEEGYDVAPTYHRRREEGEAVAAACAALGVEALPLQMTADDPASCRAAVEAVARHFGRVDVLVNNAGVDGQVAPLPDYDEAEFTRILNTNVLGTFYMTKYAAQRMIAGGRGGAVVNLSSITALYGSGGNPAYCAAKAAIDGFTRSAAKDLAQYGISVNSVAPGVTETDMVRTLSDEHRALMARSVRFGRFCRPEEIAAAVAFFAREEARYASGQTLAVDGITTL